MSNWTSRIMIYDFEEARAFPVLETDMHIEAPNWTPDGSALLVNGDGRLFEVDLAEPELAEIDTGLLITLNNDHGISPDGSTLFLSDHTLGAGSLIWTLDLESDDDPVQVTPSAPSWWHGVSPDGKTLAYTAMRNGTFGIWTCPVGGGSERCVIESDHHYDGPDYTPDGDWIWFNSERSGRGSSDLWRVRVDGAQPQQMTDDTRVNWFPHPSPDGTRVVYLSYPEGTKGHPADLEVELRLIGPEGGTSTTLVSLFGGQGTINVPSWSPDGVAFAYVEYARK
ncbi:TolB family protein [Celeribacter marinus]|uniref:TolB family protein n=1 Tax=Celeribacter marinus TaxID=1397108 RepID=UPI003F6C0C75